MLRHVKSLGIGSLRCTDWRAHGNSGGLCLFIYIIYLGTMINVKYYDVGVCPRLHSGDYV